MASPATTNAPLTHATRIHWRAFALGTACGLLMLAGGFASWHEQRQVRAEAELHDTWLPLVEAAGDLKSDLDAWQEEPVPLLAERVDARLAQIRKLADSSSDLGGESSADNILRDVHGRWQALQSGRSSDWNGLHDRLRQLSVTGLMQSQKLADLAAGRGA
ncbi:hypothetical protein [Aquabacterium sp. UBA2148]|uniref:hypothetical protein n=1 Tax=Aquabacterium sp. UBA2148 TaxID=1946042 RepID=UPI00257BAAA3|nr:hypothetical protein [Aquabacterium sp. UBA2148]